MSECSSAVSWTQTKSELTVVVQLPSGSRARDDADERPATRPDEPPF